MGSYACMHILKHVNPTHSPKPPKTKLKKKLFHKAREPKPKL